MKKLNLITKEKASIDSVDIKEKDIDMRYFEDTNDNKLLDATKCKMAIRDNMEFEGKAIHLSNAYDYVLGIDSDGLTILVPLKKK